MNRIVSHFSCKISSIHPSKYLQVLYWSINSQLNKISISIYKSMQSKTNILFCRHQTYFFQCESCECVYLPLCTSKKKAKISKNYCFLAIFCSSKYDLIAAKFNTINIYLIVFSKLIIIFIFLFHFLQNFRFKFFQCFVNYLVNH